MSTLIVTLEKKSGAFPPIFAAAMTYPVARRHRCDRIRVEQYGGVRVADFPVATVERFVRHYRLAMQPDRLAQRGADWEPHRPMWAGLARAATPGVMTT